jgi:predicted metalloprotease
VPRCKAWFDLTLEEIEHTWTTILDERENGSYVLRQPTKRIKKEEVHLGCSVTETDFEQSLS